MRLGGLDMGLIRYLVGELIEQIEEINSDLKYGPADVRGMTITKEIIPTKADVTGTDLSRFIVVKPNEFIYNPRTHGKRIGFGYNNTEDTIIISWNNIAFRVKTCMKNIVLSDYLFLHFKRDEWDREACFQSWGSSTEVFSWGALCEMALELPPLPIQQKYVDIYNSMLTNQQNYEHGLDDLKLVCDAYVEEQKRNMQSKKIGQYLRECDNRNIIGITVENVRGISTSKELIFTKANMNGVSLDSYKLVAPGQIAYVPDTSRRGDKISIGMNDTTEVFLISSISVVFETDKDVIIPEYLMLFLTRSEFDRYARFNSWGSARETFSFGDMCEVSIPIPDIDIQKNIVDIYKSYKERMSINEKLKSQIKDICPILIKGSIEEARNTKEA